MAEKVEVLRGLEEMDYRIISGYFPEFKQAYQDVDDEFEASELLEETDISRRRTLQVLDILDENGVVDELEEGYRKNGYDPETVEQDLEILREHY